MHIDFKVICRGSGNVYSKVRFADANPALRLKLHCISDEGSLVPSQLLPFDEGSLDEYIVVVPILAIPQVSLLFEAVDENGQSTDQARVDLNFDKAKWESRLNYKLHKELCASVRDYETREGKLQTQIELWYCIPDGEQDILRGSVQVPYYADSDVQIACMTRSLQIVNTRTTILRNAVSEPDSATGLQTREVQFSLRIPSSESEFILYVSDAAHVELDTYEWVEAFRLGELRASSTEFFRNAQQDPGYPEWFKQHAVTSDEIKHQKSTSFAYSPVFSIIVPLFNTPLDFFEEMVQSVLDQTYSQWELVLVNASPENEELRACVEQKLQDDPRIKEVRLDENKGISENTNAGIAVATGDFICFFDHDDTIEPDLLFEYASALNVKDDIDLLYCDEDKIMLDGQYGDPYFKSDFSIDLLRDNNYICHLLSIRKTLLEQLEPNTAEFDGAQDHNLTLQAIERARRVWHVRKMLYHWRMSKTSTAANADSKPYATIAGIKAVQSHLDRLGIKAKVSQSRRPFTYRVDYLLPEEHPLVSIVIPTKDHVDVLDTCIKSIIDKSTYDAFEILLMENNSEQEETFAYYKTLLETYPDIVRLETVEGEFNYSKLMNFGITHARGEYVLMLNNDTEVITPDWIEIMLGICLRKEVGVVGARLFFPDNTIQHAGVVVSGHAANHLNIHRPRGNWGYFALADTCQNLSAVTGACMMVKREAFDAVGGWTEELRVEYNDVDYCLKNIEQGYLVVYTPNVELYHHESLTRSDGDGIEKQLQHHRDYSYMHYRWAEYYIKGDPYVNSNLANIDPANCFYKLRW